ncbi:hypothetical protein NFHSH190041_33450 [Shewanella sp. NFH-SH190041]|nr:hypothetical protein NFHSH190041_33450 [Shewanella sp. NFH-SH190041]
MIIRSWLLVIVVSLFNQSMLSARSVLPHAELLAISSLSFLLTSPLVAAPIASVDDSYHQVAQSAGINHDDSYALQLGDAWWQTDFMGLLLLALLVAGVLALAFVRQRQIRRMRRMNTALQESEDRLLQALHGSDSELWEWRRDTRKVHLSNRHNAKASDGDEVALSLDAVLIHPDDKPRVNALWQNIFSGTQQKFETEYRYRRPDSSWGWLRVRGRALLGDEQQVEKVVGIYSDITLRRTLQDEAHLLAQAFENTTEGVLILDAEQKIKVANSAARTLLPADLIGREFATLMAGEGQIGLATLEQNWNGELELLSGGGSCPVWLNLSVMRDDHQRIQHYVAVFSDIRERKRQEADLRRLANYDVLTGLPNRSLFSSHLLKTIQLAEQQGQKLALMFMDLDRFKHVNDSFGHGMGDALLVEAAARLQGCVTSEYSLCRFGGDEFVVLLQDAGDRRQVNELANCILQQMATPFKLYGREFFITTSIGISIWPDDATQPETLIKNADLAMYHAKEEGRGHYQYYSSERNAEALYHLRLEADIRKALERDEFELHYQPQIDVLREDRMVGMEALIRWQHPQDGYIRPDIFVRVAEACGLVIEIDLWVLEEACTQGARWCAALEMPVKMSVNISAVHFRQPEFVEGVERILAKTGMKAENLELEITEGVLMKELKVAQKHLKMLAELGISVAIDDFGTGYSSLAYLRHFNVHSLKIDRTFLIDIATNSSDQAIVSSIVELARNLKLQVIAEGVETQEQLEQTFVRGCYVIQGYYFAKPMPQELMDEYLRHNIAIPGAWDKSGS